MIPRVLRFMPIALLVAFAPAAAALTVAGTVYDAAQEPVEAASVWVCTHGAVLTAETDAEGAFRFTDLEPGDIDLVIYKEGFALGGATAPLFEDADEIVVDLAPAATAVARVVGPDHAPINGARLRFAVVDDFVRVRFDQLVEHGMPSIRSNADGMLEIPWARPGGFVALVASDNEWADAAIPYLPVGDEPLTLMLPEGGELRGRITGPNGKGVARASVDVYAASGELERIFTTATSDADGFYHRRVPTGSYRVRAVHPAYVAPTAPRADLPFKGSDARIDIRMEIPKNLSGRVVNQDGEGMTGVSVTYWVEELPYISTYTTVDGSYDLRVPSGEGRVRVAAPDGYMRDKPTDVIAHMTSEPDAELTPITVRALPTLSGTVVDTDGAPVANAIVRITDLGVPLWQRTDENGGFKLRFAFEPGTDELTYWAEHPRRFQRALGKVVWRDGFSDPIGLMRFDADVTPCDPANVPNNIESLRGKPAPDLHCTAWLQSPFRGPAGAPAFDLAKMRDKVVVLTLWGGFDERGQTRTWMEWLNTLAAMFTDADDVVFVGVHDGVSDPADTADYVNAFGIKYAIGIDGANETFDRYDTNVIPQTFLIDKKGVVRYYDVQGRLLELVKTLRIEG